MTDDTLIDAIFQRFEDYGSASYVGEPVSVSEHMLQAAMAAEADNASESLIVAGLLHDFGHLLHELPEDAAEYGIDTRHEELAFEYLSRYFRAEVVRPIHLHVAAKRYLCAVEPAYLAALSPASLLSLKLQGGPFTLDEAREFEHSPHAIDAILLRRYDDAAKGVGTATRALAEYRPVLQRERLEQDLESRA